MAEPIVLQKIISGAQTGADRGALDFAIDKGFPYFGFVPKGRIAADGVIPCKYEHLIETISKKYPPRTEKNVTCADGTLVFVKPDPGAGVILTKKMCKVHKKPYFEFSTIIDNNSDEFKKHCVSLYSWLKTNNIKKLNVAGPKAPGFHKNAYNTLDQLFKDNMICFPFALTKILSDINSMAEKSAFIFALEFGFEHGFSNVGFVPKEIESRHTYSGFVLREETSRNAQIPKELKHLIETVSKDHRAARAEESKYPDGTLVFVKNPDRYNRSFIEKCQPGIYKQLIAAISRQSNSWVEGNVAHSDGTLVFLMPELNSNVKLTIDVCDRHGKPYFKFPTNQEISHAEFTQYCLRLYQWLQSNRVRKLNVINSDDKDRNEELYHALEYLCQKGMVCFKSGQNLPLLTKTDFEKMQHYWLHRLDLDGDETKAFYELFRNHFQYLRRRSPGSKVNKRFQGLYEIVYGRKQNQTGPRIEGQDRQEACYFDSLVVGFFCFKMLRTTTQTLDSISALNHFFEQYLISEIRSYKTNNVAYDDETTQSDPHRTPTTESISKILVKEDPNFASNVTEKAKHFFDDCYESGNCWVLLYLALHQCLTNNESDHTALVNIARDYDISAYHYKAGLLGITWRSNSDVHRGEQRIVMGMVQCKRYKITMIGRWLTKSLGIALVMDSCVEVMVALRSLCNVAVELLSDPVWERRLEIYRIRNM